MLSSTADFTLIPVSSCSPNDLIWENKVPLPSLDFESTSVSKVEPLNNSNIVGISYTVTP